MLSATDFNWGAKSGWFWLGIGIFCVSYTFLRVPETKDRTYLEIDRMFEEGVPARKFKATRYGSKSCLRSVCLVADVACQAILTYQ